MASKLSSDDLAATEPLLGSIDSPRLSLDELNEREIAENPTSTTQDAQAGVQKAEAAALVWSKSALYGIFAWIWITFFIIYLQSAINFQLSFTIYSEFAAAPQVTQSQILSSIIGGVLGLPLSKSLNVWGRAEAMVVFVTLYTLGIVFLAACTGPMSFAIGYTIYNVGYGGTYFILNIFVADTTGLYNRAFAIALTGLPSVVTSFVAPPIAQAFLTHSSWRWAYGVFAIVIPMTLLPMAAVFMMYQKKAEDMGIFVRPPDTGRSVRQSIMHYFVEFDFIGALLLTIAMVLMLLPFTLHSKDEARYTSTKLIAMVVLGFLMLPVFVLWELHGLPQKTGKHYIKWDLLKNRTILGACLLCGISFFSFYAWDNYFYYYIEVVYDLSVSRTGYVTSVNGLMSAFWQVLFGLHIRRTKHFKNACLYLGVPVTMIGAGMLIYFRSSAAPLEFMILGQLFLGVGWGTLLIGQELAVMAASDRDGVPLVISLMGLFGAVFGSVAGAATNAVYTKVFPAALLQKLPADTVGDYMAIFMGGPSTQMKYPVGSDTRNAINYAYSETQKYECIMAAAMIVLAIPAIAVWKDHRVDRQQVKGTVL
ncbi:MAG: hypothetical protein SEPTF4163_003051 [Sporothrix epigloea]